MRMRSVQRTCVSCCAAAAATFALAAAEAGAGVVPISRASVLRVEGVAESDTFDVSERFEQFGGYSDELADQASDPNGTTARATATQNSTADVAIPGRLGGAAVGGADVFAMFSPDDNSGPLMVGASSRFDLRFLVTDRAEPFRVAGQFGGSFGSATVS